MTSIKTIRETLEARKDRSAWNKGVTLYALELLDSLEELTSGGYFDMNDFTKPRALRSALLNGAQNWKEFSWGGCSLIYDTDIAKRLCNPSELKRTHNGERKPNAREEWLDTQARALFQAANLIYSIGANA